MFIFTVVGGFVAGVLIVTLGLLWVVWRVTPIICSAEKEQAIQSEIFALRREALAKNWPVDHIERIVNNQAKTIIGQLRGRYQKLKDHAKRLEQQVKQYREVETLQGSVAELQQEKKSLEDKVAKLKAKVTGEITLDGYPSIIREFMFDECTCGSGQTEWVGKMSYADHLGITDNRETLVSMCLSCGYLRRLEDSTPIPGGGVTWWYHELDRDRWANMAELAIRKQSRKQSLAVVA